MNVSGDRDCDFHKILWFRDNKEAQKTVNPETRKLQIGQTPAPKGAWMQKRAYTPVKVGCWDCPLPPIAHWMRSACNLIPQFKAKALASSQESRGVYRRLLGHGKINIKGNKTWQLHRVS